MACFFLLRGKHIQGIARDRGGGMDRQHCRHHTEPWDWWLRFDPDRDYGIYCEERTSGTDAFPSDRKSTRSSVWCAHYVAIFYKEKSSHFGPGGRSNLPQTSRICMSTDPSTWHKPITNQPWEGVQRQCGSQRLKRLLSTSLNVLSHHGFFVISPPEGPSRVIFRRWGRRRRRRKKEALLPSANGCQGDSWKGGFGTSSDVKHETPSSFSQYRCTATASLPISFSSSTRHTHTLLFLGTCLTISFTLWNFFFEFCPTSWHHTNDITTQNFRELVCPAEQKKKNCLDSDSLYDKLGRIRFRAYRRLRPQANSFLG